MKTGITVPRGLGAVEIFENPEDLIQAQQQDLRQEVAALTLLVNILEKRVTELEKQQSI